jgi:thioredoxin reductase
VTPTHDPTYDAVVVGGGPAGLAAATWVARYRRTVALLDGGEPRNRWVDLAHGYLGDDPVNPATLAERAREQLLRYPEAEHCVGEASEVGRDRDGLFQVVTEGGGPVLRARRLVLATGVRDRFPEVDRFFEHYGASVFHCPTCDGYEAREADVVVFGWSEDVTGFALTLLGWARSVTVVTDGRTFEGDAGCRRRLADAGVAVLEDDATELLGPRGGLEGVTLRDAGVLPCGMAFFSIAHEPRTRLAEQLGCRLTDEGCIDVDHDAATSVPGVYAAWDVTPGLQLVQVAAAKGATAGVSCAQSLRGEGGMPASWHGRVVLG